MGKLRVSDGKLQIPTLHISTHDAIGILDLRMQVGNLLSLVSPPDSQSPSAVHVATSVYRSRVNQRPVTHL